MFEMVLRCASTGMERDMRYIYIYTSSQNFFLLVPASPLLMAIITFRLKITQFAITFRLKLIRFIMFL